MKAAKKFVKMQGIGLVRYRLGMSQSKFAVELGISQSMLSRAENKTRSLPPAAIQKLSMLEATLAEKQPVTPDSSSKTAAFTTSSEIAEKVKLCLLKIKTYQYELTQATEHCEILSKNLEEISVLIHAAASGNSPMGITTMEEQQNLLLNKLEKKKRLQDVLINKITSMQNKAVSYGHQERE